MSSYQIVNDYLGREYIESERYGVYASKEDREKFSWETGDDDTDYVVNVTKTHLIIQDQVSFIGSPHSVRVPVRKPEAQVYCDKLERAITDLDRRWIMARKKQEIAWYSVCYGTGVGVLQWDKDNKIPSFVARSPENLYVQPSVDDETQPQLAIFVYKTLGRSLKASYPDAKTKELDDNAEYDLIDYYSPEERVRFVDNEGIELVRAKNVLNRVPVYLFPGILMANSMWGSSMLLRGMPAEKEIVRLYSQQALYLRDAVEAPMVINDPVNVPENARWNRDMAIEVGPQGRVSRAQTASIDGQMLEYRLREMENNLNQAMDFSPILQGQAVGSYLTGKGVTSLQQPIIQRLASKLQPMFPIYSQVYKDALILWNKAGSGSYTVYGEKSGSMFAEEFNPKKDIDPRYVENIVYLDTASFVDRTSAKIGALQELGQGVKSKRRYLELDPDCDDVELELQRIKEDRMEDIQLQVQQAQMMNAASQPQMQAAPGQPTAVQGQVPPEGQPSEPGQSPTTGEPPVEGAPPGGEAGEDILGPVAEVFRGIKKIRGQVFLVGDILLDGLTAEEIAGSFLEVIISEPLDKQTILNGIRQTLISGFADQGQIVFHENMAMLDGHPNLEVTPGTTGTTVSEGAPQAPEEVDVGPGLPEEAQTGGPVPGEEPPPGGMPPQGGLPPELMGMM